MQLMAVRQYSALMSPLLAHEIVDAACMDTAALREFFEREMDAAENDSILLSLHLKATMMKVFGSDHFWTCGQGVLQECL